MVRFYLCVFTIRDSFSEVLNLNIFFCMFFNIVDMPNITEICPLLITCSFDKLNIDIFNF